MIEVKLDLNYLNNNNLILFKYLKAVPRKGDLIEIDDTVFRVTGIVLLVNVPSIVVHGREIE